MTRNGWRRGLVDAPETRKHAAGPSSEPHANIRPTGPSQVPVHMQFVGRVNLERFEPAIAAPARGPAAGPGRARRAHPGAEVGSTGTGTATACGRRQRDTPSRATAVPVETSTVLDAGLGCAARVTRVLPSPTRAVSSQLAA